MSLEQLELVVRDVAAVFNSWGQDTPITTIRSDWDNLFSNVKPDVGATAEAVDADGVKAEWISAPEARSDRAILYLHGGGYVLGSIHSHRDVCERFSRATKARVLAIDYRLAPEHPFPAALDDAMAAYRWLLKQGFTPASGDRRRLRRWRIVGRHAGCAEAVRRPSAGMRRADVAVGRIECSGESMVTKDAEDPMVHKPMTLVMSSTYVQSGDIRTPWHPLSTPICPGCLR